jgi:flavin reductase (DIM6/NTAB) family NADH-FMN oxidoreductase RutF
MQFDPTGREPRETYRFLNGGIVPRPIAWVSSQDRNGTNNLAPFSFFNGVASNPPSLSISITHTEERPAGHKDTLHNILELGEFVVNIVSETTAAAMVETSANFLAEVDEFYIAGVTPAQSTRVRPPRVAESPVSFECKLHDTMQVGEGAGSSRLVVGVVLYIHIHDNILDEHGYIDIQRLQPVGRLGGTRYCTIRETFDLVRKTTT